MTNVRCTFETSSSEHNQMAIRNQKPGDRIWRDREYEDKALVLDPLVRTNLSSPKEHDEYFGYRITDLKTKANIIWNLILETVWPNIDDHPYLNTFYQVMSDHCVTPVVPAEWCTNLQRYIREKYPFDCMDKVIDTVSADLIPFDSDELIPMDELLRDENLMDQLLFDTRSFIHLGEVNAYVPIRDPNYRVVIF